MVNGINPAKSFQSNKNTHTGLLVATDSEGVRSNAAAEQLQSSLKAPVRLRVLGRAQCPSTLHKSLLAVGGP